MLNEVPGPGFVQWFLRKSIFFRENLLLFRQDIYRCFYQKAVRYTLAVGAVCEGRRHSNWHHRLGSSRRVFMVFLSLYNYLFRKFAGRNKGVLPKQFLNIGSYPVFPSFWHVRMSHPRLSYSVTETDDPVFFF